MFATFNTKFPTWDGAGRECKLSFTIVCLFVQALTTVLAMTAWIFAYMQMKHENLQLGINYFVLGGHALLSIIVMVHWRIVHQYQVRILEYLFR